MGNHSFRDCHMRRRGKVARAVVLVLSVTRKNDLIGVPEGVDTTHPRSGRAERLSESGGVATRTLESERLMGDKVVRIYFPPCRLE